MRIEHYSLVEHFDRMARGVEGETLIAWPNIESGSLPIPTFGPIEAMQPEDTEKLFLNEHQRPTRRTSVRHVATGA